MNDVRHRIPSGRKVPLWTPEPEGQLFQGMIRVPVRLCHAEAHTNARHEFDKLIRENINRWAYWRKLRGWHIAERPRVSGPFDPPESDAARSRKYYDRAKAIIGTSGEANEITAFDHAEEVKWYIAEARFTREDPVYARLEDMLELRHMAINHGVDPDRDFSPETALPDAKDEIAFEGGLDPMQVAEERRQAKGLKREDYLMGELTEPL